MAVTALLALTAPLAAQTTALEPLTRRDQLLGWEAVGRLDLGGGQFCTGTLIAPDLVLTAAHCVFGPDDQPLSPSKMRFRAGYADGIALAESGVARVAVDPGYGPGDQTDLASRSTQLRLDVALIELAQPIPAAQAAPFTVALPGAGAAVSVVSYAAGREEAPSWQRSCRLLAHEAGLLAVDCDVTFGASGAPVLDRSGARATIVSIISAGRQEGAETLAFGMELPALVAGLKHRLQRGQVLIAPQTASPTVQGSKGARALSGAGTGASRDIGARFVKP